jgi:hypothetical protein
MDSYSANIACNAAASCPEKLDTAARYIPYCTYHTVLTHRAVHTILYSLYTILYSLYTVHHSPYAIHHILRHGEWAPSVASAESVVDPYIASLALTYCHHFVHLDPIPQVLYIPYCTHTLGASLPPRRLASVSQRASVPGRSARLYYYHTHYALYTHYALTMHSLCTHYALTMHSLCTHYTFTVHSLCTHYALTMHSLCTHYALTMHSLCTHYALTMHSLYTLYIVHSH